MKPGELIHLTGPVWLLVGQRQGRFPFCHGVLIKDRAATALVDTGGGAGVLAPLARSGQVEMVINSHTHPDHSAGNHLFAGAEILVPAAGWDTAGDKRKLSERLTEPGRTAEVWRRFVTQEMGFADQRPTGSFAPGHSLWVGSTELQVIATPGHTLDHCCFWLPRHGVLLSADLDLTSFGPFYGHRESSLAQMRADIRRIGEIAPRWLVSSHRAPMTQGVAEALRAFGEILGQRERRILALLAEEKTRQELVDASPIYGGHRTWPELTRYWEGQMIDKHLEELLSKEMVRFTGRGFLAA